MLRTQNSRLNEPGLRLATGFFNPEASEIHVFYTRSEVAPVSELCITITRTSTVIGLQRAGKHVSQPKTITFLSYISKADHAFNSWYTKKPVHKDRGQPRVSRTQDSHLSKYIELKYYYLKLEECDLSQLSKAGLRASITTTLWHTAASQNSTIIKLLASQKV